SGWPLRTTHAAQALERAVDKLAADDQTPGFAQTQRCGSAEPRHPRDDRIPGERSSRPRPEPGMPMATYQWHGTWRTRLWFWARAITSTTSVRGRSQPP